MDYIRDIPTLLSQIWRELFTPGGMVLMFRVRVLSLSMLAIVYLLSPLDIIPERVFGIAGMIDDFVILVIVVVFMTLVFRNLLAERAHRARA